MGCELDNLMYQAWLKLQDRVLADPLELRRRLDRRAKMFDRVPRSLCLAIKASDRRITPTVAWLSDRDATRPRNESEHDVPLFARTIQSLTRPIELHWSQHFRDLAHQLGGHRQVPRRLERRGLLRARRIPLLAGQRGLPVPIIDSPLPATAPPEARQWEHYGFSKHLDPSAWGYTPPDKLLAPYWEELSFRLPESFQQTIRRKPVFRVQREHLRFMHWVWICPQCQRAVNTIYLPIGAPDFLAAHNIQLPQADADDPPQPHLALACKQCHHLFNLARTPKSLTVTWSLLIAHMSCGLLFGREVPRPASFAALRPNQPVTARAPRPCPRRDELEAYLAHTDLPLKEIARRMHWTCASVNRELYLICKKRQILGTRHALQQYWITRATPHQTTLRAA